MGILDQGDALPGCCRPQQQKVFFKTHPAPSFITHLHAMGLQPEPPVGAVTILQQRVVQAIGRLQNRRPLGQQPGACDRQ
ncbi:hypothetical protein D3C80_1866980 [compost metagenome]